MADLSPNIPIISLNVNVLNIPTKKQKLAEWIKIMIHPYAIYKKLTSNTKTQIG